MQHKLDHVSVTAITSFLILALVVTLCVSGCSENTSTQPEAMLNEDLKCPDNATGEIRRWGGIDENGWSHSCRMNHGKYHVWRNDVLAIEGQYKFGEKEGEWVFRDKKGEVIRVVVYKDGEVVSEERK